MVVRMRSTFQKLSKSSKIGPLILAPTQHYEKFLKKKSNVIGSLELVHSNYMDFYQCPSIQTTYNFLSHPIK